MEPSASVQEHPQKESVSNEFPCINAAQPPHRGNILLHAVRFVWKILLLPAMAFTYLAVCYICLYRQVQIHKFANFDPMEHLSTVKSGVTSISILYVTINLLPLYSLLSDLKSEEFFRTLSVKKVGAPLSTVNGISSPSYGVFDTLLTLYHRRASKYFTGVFVTGFIAIAASTLAPAALAVNTIIYDGDLVAFSVGALPPGSVLNTSDFRHPEGVGTSTAVDSIVAVGGNVAWAEFNLGLNYSFISPTVGETAYIVPAPLQLPLSMNARWISDVVVMRPSCEWVAPVFLTNGANFSDLPTIAMNLTMQHLQVTFSANILEIITSASLKPMAPIWFSGVNNGSDTFFDTDTMDGISNGATLWMLQQCVTNCTPDILQEGEKPTNVTFGPDVHSSRYSSVDGISFDIAFLYCIPNARIETYHIANDGHGNLAIGDQVPATQGNLHPVQTNLLLSFVLNSFDQAGPSRPENTSFLGNQVQFAFAFGHPAPGTTQIAPLPPAALAAAYGRILQSAAKPYIDGSLGSAYVPARVSREFAVLTASLPSVVASTALYALLIAFVLVCQRRRHVPQFTLSAVAAALAHPEIPAFFAQIRAENHVLPGDDTPVGTLRGTKVFLEEEGQILRFRRDQ